LCGGVRVHDNIVDSDLEWSCGNLYSYWAPDFNTPIIRKLAVNRS
jgi:hypothetical protein